MRGALAGLAVRLQAVSRRGQQFGHQLPADGMAHSLQGVGQLAHALGGPAQRRLRIARGSRLHQPLEIREQGGIFVQGALAPAARAPHASRGGARPRRQLVQPAPHRGICDPRRAGHRADPAPPGRLRLRRGPDPAPSLRQRRPQRLVFRPPEPQVHGSNLPLPWSYSVQLLSDSSLEPPGLRRRRPVADQILGDRRLRDLDAQLLEFPVNPRRAPQGVGARHSSDERAHLRVDARTAWPVSGDSSRPRRA